jgi:hypothetical protein
MTADPWALLREARESLSAYTDEDQVNETLSWHGRRWDKAQALVVTINAALAERQDSATDVVESDDSVLWDVTQATCNGLRLVCEEWKGRWAWCIEGVTHLAGECDTLAEAKSAAIAAARGLR